MKHTLLIITALMLVVGCEDEEEQKDCAGVAGGSSVEDIDGNCYATVQIGEQLWMAENLKVTHYRNEDEIQYVIALESIGEDVWVNLTTGAYGYYYDVSSNLNTYGNLYNWYAVDDERGICPEKFHVPSDDEFIELEMFLGMSIEEAYSTGWRGGDLGGRIGGMMKEIGTEHWNSPNTGATNESGFTSLPGGFRSHNPGVYTYMGDTGYFWSTTEESSEYRWRRELKYNQSGVHRGSGDTHRGYSVRCVKD
jgi:uncharacterized protein (TIGR02145 family)